uniref:C2H2-type domain-containing protein n=1 Tax=Sinocyclocheilus grahami TaxID=75366 RepID=A0A672NF57_SINGR
MKSAGAGDEGLFTESYCNICNAQLISESQRVAHYEVSTHTQRERAVTHITLKAGLIN